MMARGLMVLLLAGILMAQACAEPLHKKRAPPDAVAEPVIVNHIRYEAEQWGKARGLEQNGGYIAAYDEVSGKELWLTKIYDIHYTSDKEADKQDVFITEIKLKNKHLLAIKDEQGHRYLLNIKTRKVSVLK